MEETSMQEQRVREGVMELIKLVEEPNCELREALQKIAEIMRDGKKKLIQDLQESKPALNELLREEEQKRLMKSLMKLVNHVEAPDSKLRQAIHMIGKEVMSDKEKELIVRLLLPETEQNKEAPKEHKVNYTWRRGRHTDFHHIKHMAKHKETSENFKEQELEYLIEHSQFPLVILRNGEIVGFAAVDDHPSLPILTSQDWTNWIERLYRLTFMPTNCRFLNYVTWKTDCEGVIMSYILRFLFKAEPRLEHVVLLLPNGYFLGEKIMDEFKEIKFETEKSKGQQKEKPEEEKEANASKSRILVTPEMLFLRKEVSEKYLKFIKQKEDKKVPKRRSPEPLNDIPLSVAYCKAVKRWEKGMREIQERCLAKKEGRPTPIPSEDESDEPEEDNRTKSYKKKRRLNEEEEEKRWMRWIAKKEKEKKMEELGLVSPKQEKPKKKEKKKKEEAKKEKPKEGAQEQKEPQKNNPSILDGEPNIEKLASNKNSKPKEEPQVENKDSDSENDCDFENHSFTLWVKNIERTSIFMKMSASLEVKHLLKEAGMDSGQLIKTIFQETDSNAMFENYTFYVPGPEELMKKKQAEEKKKQGKKQEKRKQKKKKTQQQREQQQKQKLQQQQQEKLENVKDPLGYIQITRDIDVENLANHYDTIPLGAFVDQFEDNIWERPLNNFEINEYKSLARHEKKWNEELRKNEEGIKKAWAKMLEENDWKLIKDFEYCHPNHPKIIQSSLQYIKDEMLSQQTRNLFEQCVESIITKVFSKFHERIMPQFVKKSVKFFNSEKRKKTCNFKEVKTTPNTEESLEVNDTQLNAPTEVKRSNEMKDHPDNSSKNKKINSKKKFDKSKDQYFNFFVESFKKLNSKKTMKLIFKYVYGNIIQSIKKYFNKHLIVELEESAKIKDEIEELLKSTPFQSIEKLMTPKGCCQQNENLESEAERFQKVNNILVNHVNRIAKTVMNSKETENKILSRYSLFIKVAMMKALVNNKNRKKKCKKGEKKKHGGKNLTKKYGKVKRYKRKKMKKHEKKSKENDGMKDLTKNYVNVKGHKRKKKKKHAKKKKDKHGRMNLIVKYLKIVRQVRKKKKNDTSEKKNNDGSESLIVKYVKVKRKIQMKKSRGASKKKYNKGWKNLFEKALKIKKQIQMKKKKDASEKKDKNGRKKLIEKYAKIKRLIRKKKKKHVKKKKVNAGRKNHTEKDVKDKSQKQKKKKKKHASKKKDKHGRKKNLTEKDVLVLLPDDDEEHVRIAKNEKNFLKKFGSDPLEFYKHKTAIFARKSSKVLGAARTINKPDSSSELKENKIRDDEYIRNVVETISEKMPNLWTKSEIETEAKDKLRYLKENEWYMGPKKQQRNYFDCSSCDSDEILSVDEDKIKTKSLLDDAFRPYVRNNKGTRRKHYYYKENEWLKVGGNCNSIIVTRFIFKTILDPSAALEVLRCLFSETGAQFCLFVISVENLNKLCIFNRFLQRLRTTKESFGKEIFFCNRDFISGNISVRKATKYDFDYLVAFTNRYRNPTESLIAQKILFYALFADTNYSVYVLANTSTVLGFMTICDFRGVDFLRAHYNLEYHMANYLHKGDDHAIVKHLDIAFAYQLLTRFFVKRVLHLSGYSSLYYVLYDDHLMERSHQLEYITGLEHFVPVAPRVLPEYSKEHLKDTIPEYAAVPFTPFGLYYLNRSISGFEKTFYEARILVIGASDTALSFIENLVFSHASESKGFRDIVILSKNGFPPHIPAVFRNSCLMIPYTGRYNEDYLKKIRLTTWITIVTGLMTGIDKSKKIVYIDHKRAIRYNYLVILCGLQFNPVIPKKVQEPPVYCQRPFKKDNIYRHKSRPNPVNLFCVNSQNEALQAVTSTIKMFQDNTDKERKIVVFGNSINTFACLASLLDCPPFTQKDIIFVESTPKRIFSIDCFNNPLVYNNTMEFLRKIQLRLHSGYEFLNWTVQGNVITEVAFQSHMEGILSIPCLSFFAFDGKTINHEAFMAISKARLLFDEKLIINQHYLTSNKFIYAAGPLTKYSRKLIASNMNHEWYSPFEVGAQLAAKIRKRLAKHSKHYKTNPRFRFLPAMVDPVIVNCHLPGKWYYLDIREPGPIVPLEVELNGQSSTGSAYFTKKFSNKNELVSYFRIALNKQGLVNHITCYTKNFNDIAVHNFMKLYGKHQELLNHLVLRYERRLIPDFFSYFKESWAYVLYHDRFPALMERFAAKFKHPVLPKDLKLVPFENEIVDVLTHHNWHKWTVFDGFALEAFFHECPKLQKSMEKKLLQFLEGNADLLPMYINKRKVAKMYFSTQHDPIVENNFSLMGVWPILRQKPQYPAMTWDEEYSKDVPPINFRQSVLPTE